MTELVTYLRVKALEDGEGRFIEGYATTPKQDRMGDIVVPEGAIYSLPIPLLFAHKHDEPIGSVVKVQVTKAGIRIRAKLTEGVARAEEAWKLLKDGALTAVSIGFQSLKHTPLPEGGLRFDSWSWHELSVVSVPANEDARVSVAKCIAYGSTPIARSPAPEAPITDREWLRTIGPQRNGETELDAFYRRFDAAAALLPPGLRECANLHRADFDKRSGTITFRDAEGNQFATVDLNTKTVREPRAAAQPEPAAVETQTPRNLVTWKSLNSTSLRICQAVGEAIHKSESRLIERIERLEAYVPVDGEAFGELANFMERVESLEKEVRDRGFHYRGYWRAGKKAVRGEAYTHNGTLFYAMQDTNEDPDPHSLEWNVLARKGRDGKDAR
jgi:HK97 family phage prohead protease